MPFDVKVSFTGLYVVVPKTPRRDQDLEACALVFPNGEGEDRIVGTAVDGQPLRRHRIFVDYDLGNLPGASAPTGSRGIWLLSDRRRRITFDFDRSGNPLKIEKLSLADLTQIAPKHSTLHPNALQWNAPDTVGAQVMFDRGTVSTPKPKDAVPELRRWAFPPTLSGGEPVRDFLSHEVHWNLSNLTSFEIVTRPLGAGPKPDPIGKLPLEAGDGETVELTIANLCDVNPLRWPTQGSPEIDDDFRWYYELLDDGIKEDVGKFLNHLHAPVPYPLGKPSAQGMNCLGSQGKSQNFVLD